MRSTIAAVFALAAVVVFSAITTPAQAPCSGARIFAKETCAGDSVSPAEKQLFEAVDAYRRQNGLPAIRMSTELSKLANRHLLDLRLNLKQLTHAWSNCPYDINVRSTWPCTMDAPDRLGTAFKGQGYETLYVTSNGDASAQPALEAWRKSTLHNSIILNLDTFKGMTWDEVGVGIDGPYAALWFGTSSTLHAGLASKNGGLGVTFEQAVKGLGDVIPMDRVSSTLDGGKWQGISADKKLKLEMFGKPGNVAEANLRIVVKLESNGALSQKNYDIISTLLKNILPDWTQREAWLEKTLKAIGSQRDATRTQNVSGVAVQMTNTDGSSLDLTIKPASAVGAREVF